MVVVDGYSLVKEQPGDGGRESGPLYRYGKCSALFIADLLGNLSTANSLQNIGCEMDCRAERFGPRMSRSQRVRFEHG